MTMNQCKLPQAFVFQFAFLARDRIFKPGAVSSIDNQLTNSPETAFAWHQKQRCIEVWMVFPKIFFPLIPTTATINI